MKKKLVRILPILVFLMLLFGSSAYAADLKPVYRLYNPSTAEHLYTTDANEKDTLYKIGWGYEGVGWYSTSSGGQGVVRLYNKGLGHHLYTTDQNEIKELTTKYGWVKDNGGNALFRSSGNCKIYRMYNAGHSGLHLLTTDANEYRTLPSAGWSPEGQKLSAEKLGSPIKTQYYKKPASASTSSGGGSSSSSSSSSSSGSTTTVSSGVTQANAKYCLNKSTLVAHYKNCRYVKQMSDANKVWANSIPGNYSHCKVCKP